MAKRPTVKRNKPKSKKPRFRRGDRSFDREKWIRHYLGKALGKMWYWYPIRRDLKDSAEVMPDRYQCDGCSRLYDRNEIAIDHIIPKIDPDTGFTTIDAWVNSWFCAAENLQRLCYICHAAKTKREGVVRTATRRRQKKSQND